MNNPNGGANPSFCDRSHNNQTLEDNLPSATLPVAEILSVVDSTSNSNMDPVNWSKTKKYFIVAMISYAGMITGISSSMLYPALSNIREEFDINEFLANILVSIYLVFLGISPLGWASYSDAFSTRRKVYLTSYVLYVSASLACAWSNSIWLLIAMRGIQSCGSSSVQSVSAGVISDIFIPSERGSAYGIFYAGYLAGQMIGPIFGGTVNQFLGWRWIFGICTILGGILVILTFFFLPETFYNRQFEETLPTTMTSRALKLRFNPFLPLKSLSKPHIILIVAYMNTLAILHYVTDVLIPRSFIDDYNLNSSQIGLVFLAPTSGYVIGSVLGGKFSDYILRKAKAMHHGIMEPEMRLHSAWISALILPTSYVIYGWFLSEEVHLALPVTMLFIAGFNGYIVQSSVSTYLVDVSPDNSASVQAANNFIRYSTSGIIIAFAVDIDEFIGVGWTFTLAGGLNFIGFFLLLITFFKGKLWREKNN
ncbi:10790_t:CDS:2 [Funneliformis geosporum]|uniref:7171_t:CDS:1 n=1 Tax=Funneliformis geosporum TaxID=1117311 RepID=A0A9W4SWU7_9GLOM|nr:10790_t:CDS:2 [Funneliformis geosporum]CAI2181970.1 7171_t:CDS:2 [Funneliformis geosporum]